MKVKVTNQGIANTHKKINSLFWRIEDWLNEVFIPYARIPSFILMCFFILAAGDHLYYGNKKDISSLPKFKQERYSFLIDKRGEIRNKRWELESQRKYTTMREEIELEIKKIHDEAPYASWGRSVMNNIKETLWGIKSN